MRLFISYAHEDRALTDRLIEELRAQGHIPRSDADLLVSDGSLWIDQLDQAIRQFDAVVYAITPAAIHSFECQDELLIASRHQKPIVRILLNSDSNEALPAALIRYQYIDGRIWNEDSRSKLRQSLEKLWEARIRRSYPILFGFGIVLILIFLMSIAILTIFPEKQRAEFLYQVGLVPATLTTTPTATVTASVTPSATPTKTITPTPLPSATPTLRYGSACLNFVDYVSRADAVQMIAACDEVLVQQPTLTAGLANRCLAKAILQQANALDDCEASIKIAGQIQAQSLSASCLAEAMLGKLNITNCDKAVEADPKLPSAYSNRAYMLYRSTSLLNGTDFENAEKDVVKAIELYGDSRSAWAAHYHYGVIYAAIARANRNFAALFLAHGLTECTTATELNPQMAEAFYCLGRISYFRTVFGSAEPAADYAKAIANYGTAIRLYPSYVEAYVERALSYYESGQRHEYVDGNQRLIITTCQEVRADAEKALQLGTDADYTSLLNDLLSGCRTVGSN